MTAPHLVDIGPICYTAFDGRRLVWRPCRTWYTAGGPVGVVTEIGDDGPSVTNAAEKVYAILRETHPGARVIEHYLTETGETFDEILPGPGGEITWRRIPGAELRRLLGSTLAATRPAGPVVDGVWPSVTQTPCDHCGCSCWRCECADHPEVWAYGVPEEVPHCCVCGDLLPDGRCPHCDPDFVILYPDHRGAVYDCRRDGERLAAAIARHIPDRAGHPMRRLRVWCADMFTPDMPVNALAARVVAGLGYRADRPWYGPVAIGMEEDSTGRFPYLTDDVRDAIDDLVSRAAGNPEQTKDDHR